MAAAGKSFRDILASLTTAPAKVFGASDRVGRIAPGLQADLVVVRGDPATDLRSLTEVRWTLCSGSIAYRAA
jgi:imidazolonepropionase-like amidohydrolase